MRLSWNTHRFSILVIGKVLKRKTGNSPLTLVDVVNTCSCFCLFAVAHQNIAKRSVGDPQAGRVLIHLTLNVASKHREFSTVLNYEVALFARKCGCC